MVAFSKVAAVAVCVGAVAAPRAAAAADVTDPSGGDSAVVNGLSAGDCAVVGFKVRSTGMFAESGDEYVNTSDFAILLLETLPAGTTLKVTDHGVTSAGKLLGQSPTEGILTYTPSTDRSAGTVLRRSDFTNVCLLF